VTLFALPIPQTEPKPQDIPGMALIPASEFWMGRTLYSMVDELGWIERSRLDDLPAHLVYVDSYYLDKYEVTNSDFGQFVEATGNRKPHHWIKGKYDGLEKYPVYNVSWDDANAYCRWVNKQLPTEAEWERAARGGLDRNLYSWGNEPPAPKEEPGGGAAGPQPTAAEKAEPPVPRAWIGKVDGPTNVGSFPPNPYGLYDMTGNVWEWVSDFYAQNYYSISPERNPTGPATGMYKVFRGGSWLDEDARWLRVYHRNFTNASTRSNTLGFRCAKSVSNPQE